MNKTFKDVLAEFPFSSIKWNGLVGYHKMKNNKIAKITLSTNGIIDNYTKFEVRIIHIDNGLIDEVGFFFVDHLEIDPKKCKNTMYSDQHLYIWNSGEGVDWFINYPISTTPIVDAVYSYIKMMDGGN